MTDGRASPRREDVGESGDVFSREGTLLTGATTRSSRRFGSRRASPSTTRTRPAARPPGASRASVSSHPARRGRNTSERSRGTARGESRADHRPLVRRAVPLGFRQSPRAVVDAKERTARRDTRHLPPLLRGETVVDGVEFFGERREVESRHGGSTLILHEGGVSKLHLVRPTAPSSGVTRHDGVGVASDAV